MTDAEQEQARAAALAREKAHAQAPAIKAMDSAITHLYELIEWYMKGSPREYADIQVALDAAELIGYIRGAVGSGGPDLVRLRRALAAARDVA